jgi:hypothetical protein
MLVDITLGVVTLGALIFGLVAWRRPYTPPRTLTYSLDHVWEPYRVDFGPVGITWDGQPVDDPRVYRLALHSGRRAVDKTDFVDPLTATLKGEGRIVGIGAGALSDTFTTLEHDDKTVRLVPEHLLRDELTAAWIMVDGPGEITVTGRIRDGLLRDDRPATLRITAQLAAISVLVLGGGFALGWYAEPTRDKLAGATATVVFLSYTNYVLGRRLRRQTNRNG